MKNPIYRAIELKQPFVYFHTHVINEQILESALQTGKTLEVDVSVAQDGSYFIGHPLSFYEYKGQPPSNNMALDEVLARLKKSDLFLVLDCKDYRALPKIHEIIKNFGPERTLLHGWIDKLRFQPYPPEIFVEPHWQYEDLPAQELFKIKHETETPLVVSCRGLTKDRLSEQGDEIIQKITDVAKGNAEVINFNLPGNEAASAKFYKDLIDNQLLPFLAYDIVLPESRPEVFIAMTDDIELASRLSLRH